MIVSAPGKIILFGEHAVVYGKHALATAIDLRCKVYVERNDEFQIDSSLGKTGIDFKVHPYVSFAIKRFCEINKIKGAKIKIESSIPVASGLGSSAAVAVATLKALSEEFEAGLSDEDIFKIARQVEIDVQGASSGIDPFVSTFGGTWLFPDKKKVELKEKEFFLIKIGERATKEMISKVAEMKKRYPELFEKIIDAIDVITLKAVDGRNLDELIYVNQSLLRALGVSNAEIDSKISELEKIGLKAKITGAGGGGCIFGIFKGFIPAGSFLVRVSEEGVRVEGT
ncbi:MAG: mevalonate kinase [Archaeoglobaceae archaeon]|nr:mevalonate kinase [Archaeoglobaceae archaeon]MCX8152564.1 mevalonate kinase [Archaeoglobaceae archaeon]MDW8014154.1 mevalonate kinase [Archaeoglobaceae archaeon]